MSSAPALRIVVDGRALAGDGPGRGIAHYLRALLTAWPVADDLRVVVPRGAAEPVAAQLRDPARAGGAVPRLEIVEHALPGRLPYAAGALAGMPRLDGGDVAWVPAPAPVAVAAPYVLTVHDRSWEARPADFTRYERAWHAAARPRRLAHGAARVLTTTRWGRDDLVAAWGLDAARVVAVHLAPVVVPAGPGADRREGVLFVGALEPRKGPDVLAQALRLARPRGFGAPVRVVGGGRLDDLLREPGVERLEAADDASLSRLHAAAQALVVPSRLEGFGLPALEALAHGTPVVATDLPPVREVLGDAATYVPAGDAAALAEALLALPAAPGPAGPLAGRTWADVARETRAALEAAAR